MYKHTTWLYIHTHTYDGCICVCVYIYRYRYISENLTIFMNMFSSMLV